MKNLHLIECAHCEAGFDSDHIIVNKETMTALCEACNDALFARSEAEYA